MTGLANCKKIDIMPTYHYVQNEKLMIQSRENGEKPQFGHFFFYYFEAKYLGIANFSENRFHSNWRSYLVLTFRLIWRFFREYLQIKTFFQNSGPESFLPVQSPNLMQKSEKSLEPFLRKLRYQPTNQPIITNNTDLIGPRWWRSKN